MADMSKNLISGLFIATASLLATAANANPTVPDGLKGVFRWPDNIVIDVYIPPDPEGLGRDKDLGAGIGNWNGPGLAGKGITINVNYGTAPAGAQNAVNVSWNDGKVTNSDGSKTDASGGPDGAKSGDNVKTKSGEIKINKDPKLKAEDVKRLGAHEMGHVLGLDHSDNEDDLMNPEPGTDKPQANDLKQLGAVFNANLASTDVKFTPLVTPLGNLFKYQYTAEWISGGELALFEVDIGTATLSSVVAPTGWSFGNPGLPADWLSSTLPGQERFAIFRLDDETSYLGPSNPILTFEFVADHSPKLGSAFLNGGFKTLAPVPEPGAWTLLILGFGALGVTLRRRRGRLVWREPEEVGDAVASTRQRDHSVAGK